MTMHSKPISQPCLRNQEPIFQAAQPFLTLSGRLLELACGTAQHAVYMASRLPHVNWHATDMAGRLGGANQWIEEAALENLSSATELNIDDKHWGSFETDTVDYIFSANLIHFVSDASVDAMFAGISRCLKHKGTVILYGPYNQNGFTSEGNHNLDKWLKAEVNPLAGIKELDHIIDLANKTGLRLDKKITMPANNLLLIFKNIN